MGTKTIAQDEIITDQIHEPDVDTQRQAYVKSLVCVKPRLVSNPIVYREFITTLRNPLSFLYLIAFVITATGFFCYVWWHMKHVPGGWLGREREHFYQLNLAIGGIICFIVPLFSATCVNIEHERRTWEMLLQSPLGIVNILLGKIISSVGFVIVLLTSLIPMYWMFAAIAKISPMDIFISFLFLSEIAAILGLIGLYCSLEFKKPYLSILFAALLTCAYFLLFVMPFSPLSQNSLTSPTRFTSLYFGASPTTAVQTILVPSGGNTAITINPTLNPAAMPVAAIPSVSPFESFIHIVFFMIVLLGLFALCLFTLIRKLDHDFVDDVGQAIRQEVKRFKPILRLRTQHERWFPDQSNPIRLKEIRELFGQKGLLLATGMTVLIILSVILMMVYSDFEISLVELNRLFVWDELLGRWPFFVIPFMVIPYAANALRSEVNRETWGQLVSTTISPARIVRGKVLAALQLFSIQFWVFMALIIAVAFQSNFKVETHLAAGWERLIGTLLLAYAFAGFLALLSIAISASVRKSTTAYGLAFALTFLIFNSDAIFQFINTLPETFQKGYGSMWFFPTLLILTCLCVRHWFWKSLSLILLIPAYLLGDQLIQWIQYQFATPLAENITFISPTLPISIYDYNNTTPWWSALIIQFLWLLLASLLLYQLAIKQTKQKIEKDSYAA